jgi:hypothetical protein
LNGHDWWRRAFPGICVMLIRVLVYHEASGFVKRLVSKEKGRPRSNAMAGNGRVTHRASRRQLAFLAVLADVPPSDVGRSDR